ncbi:MAG: hypothetical protein JWQ29_443 [Phenylobacterium sp.]|nr:hypothetical protein [Phenylobacterium sp.]
MEEIFRSYWWLLFPIGFFVFGAWDRWLAYRRSRDQLELLKSYASQGKEPPPELVKAMRDDDPLDGADPRYGGYGYGYGMHPRHMRRMYRRAYRWSPYWQWRAVFVTGAVAAGFWFASEYADFPGTEGPFRLVAIIMTFVAGGNLIAAVFSSLYRGR